MKLVAVKEVNDGYKLVTFSFQVDNIEIECDFFISPNGVFEPHKNTKHDLERQVLNVLRKNNASELLK